jgi:hypothetical protein
MQKMHERMQKLYWTEDSPLLYKQGVKNEAIVVGRRACHVGAFEGHCNV